MANLNATDKETILSSVRRVLPAIKASSTPPYRRLLEEVGLPVPPMTNAYSPVRQQYQPNSNWSTSPNHFSLPQQGGGSYNPYGQPPSGIPGIYANGNLSPLLMPQNMSLGQAMRGGGSTKGPRTPQTAQRGRLSPASQMMSPASDPFNPVCLCCWHWRIPESDDD